MEPPTATLTGCFLLCPWQWLRSVFQDEAFALLVSLLELLFQARSNLKNYRWSQCCRDFACNRKCFSLIVCGLDVPTHLFSALRLLNLFRKRQWLPLKEYVKSNKQTKPVLICAKAAFQGTVDYLILQRRLWLPGTPLPTTFVCSEAAGTDEKEFSNTLVRNCPCACSAIPLTVFQSKEKQDFGMSEWRHIYGGSTFFVFGMFSTRPRECHYFLTNTICAWGGRFLWTTLKTLPM